MRAEREVRDLVGDLLPPNLMIDPSVCDLVGKIPELENVGVYSFAQSRFDGAVPEISETDFWSLVLQGGYGAYSFGLLVELLHRPIIDWPPMLHGRELVFGGAKLCRRDRHDMKFVTVLLQRVDIHTGNFHAQVEGSWTRSPYWYYTSALVTERSM
jgi:hypothetical protein